MHKKKRKDIVFEIGETIINECRTCEHNGKAESNVHICKFCPTGKELKRLGQSLEELKTNPVVDVTKEKWPSTYQRSAVNKQRKEIHDRLRAKGKSVEQVAVELGMNYNTLLYHRKKWRKEGAVL